MYNMTRGRATWAMMLGSFLTLPSFVEANKLANPGFELPDATAGDLVGVTGWNEFGEPGTRYVTRRTPSYEGSQCLKMFGPWVQYAGTGMSQAFAAAPGQTWLAQVYARNDSGDPMGLDNFCVMKVEFLDSTMNLVGTKPLAGVNVFEARLADTNTPRDLWQLSTIGTAPAPAGTAFARFLIVEVQGHAPAPSGGSVFLDAASFEELCSLHNPVFDANDDHKVNMDDLEEFTSCMTGPGIPLPVGAPAECACLDRNHDQSIDQQDFGTFQVCYSGTAEANPACDD